MAKPLFTIHFEFADTGERGKYAIEAKTADEARTAAIAFYAPRKLFIGKVKVSRSVGK